MTSRPNLVKAQARHLAVASWPALERIRHDAQGKPPRVATMLHYLEFHLFDTGLNVASWKQATGVRDDSVVIEFHSSVGIPPKLYLDEKRCDVAGRLLVSTDLTVWQIADLTGFNSFEVFSKAFARIHGARPSNYRREHRDRPQPSRTCTPVTACRALAGTLTEAEARDLIDLILQVYPGVAVDP